MALPLVIEKGATVKHLVLIVFIVCSLMQAQTIATDFPIEGKQAPSFDLPDLSMLQHSLADYLDKPVVINFWTTWCGACAYEFPVLEEFYQRYGEQISLVTICAGNSQEDALALVTEKEVSFPVLYDDEEIISSAYQPTRPHDKRRIVAFPFTVFIDETGRVTYARIGTFTDIEKMVELLQEAGVTLTAPSPLPAESVQPIEHGEKAKEG